MIAVSYLSPRNSNTGLPHRGIDLQRPHDLTRLAMGRPASSGTFKSCLSELGRDLTSDYLIIYGCLTAQLRGTVDPSKTDHLSLPFAA